ncbi:hypothetical protein Tco_0270485 [Tanacetum coccineum]
MAFIQLGGNSRVDKMILARVSSGLQGRRDCKMVVKEIVSRLLEEEEKLEWWFEQDIDKEEVRFEGDEDGDELEDVGRRAKIQKKRKKCFEMERKDWNEKIHHHFHQWDQSKDEMTMDD